MKCKLCGCEKKLIKAHVIPEAFFRRHRNGDKTPKIMTDIKGIFPKKSPIGIYDMEILCQDCEDLFDNWDSYATNLLINQLNKFESVYNGNKVREYSCPSYDYSKLKLFFISVLWKSSVSKKDFYSDVKLGSYEEIAKRHILNSDPGDENDFSTLLSLFSNDINRNEKSSLILDPQKCKLQGVNIYKFNFGGLIAYIKTDKRLLSQIFYRLLLSPNRPLNIKHLKFSESKEQNTINNILEAAHI